MAVSIVAVSIVAWRWHAICRCVCGWGVFCACECFVRERVDFAYFAVFAQISKTRSIHNSDTRASTQKSQSRNQKPTEQQIRPQHAKSNPFPLSTSLRLFGRATISPWLKRPTQMKRGAAVQGLHHRPRLCTGASNSLYKLNRTTSTANKCF